MDILALIRKHKNKVRHIRSKISYIALIVLVGFGVYYAVSTLREVSAQVKFNESKIRIIQKLDRLDNAAIKDPAIEMLITGLYERAIELIDKKSETYKSVEGMADLIWYSYNAGLQDGYDIKRYSMGLV